MRDFTLLIAAALLGAGASVASPVWSQSFAGSPSTAGQLSVQADVPCACRWFAASDLRASPAGYRWDCGILRARTGYEVPATANPCPYPLPEAL